MNLPASPQVTVVVGLQFGDEGKGQIVDRLAPGHDAIVRFNGGANAGHSVRIAGEKIALHQLPSGVLTPGKLNVIGNGCVLDVAGLIAEIDKLQQRGIDPLPGLRVSDRAHLVLPWHKAEDRLYDTIAAGTDGLAKVGTTGRGIGPAYADKMLRIPAVRVHELLDLKVLGVKLRAIATIKNATLAALADLAGEDYVAISPAAVLDELRLAADRLRPAIADTVHLLQTCLAEGQRILCEGANAALLDVDHGTYPFVTSSNASVLGVGPGCGIAPTAIGRVIGVVKAYTSRVGDGPFPTELDGEQASRLRDKGGEYGTTTGRPRRIGWFDRVAVARTARLNGVHALAVTGLGVLADEPALRVGTGYTLGGEAIAQPPADIHQLAAVVPTYLDLPGYAGPLNGVLPAAAEAFVAALSDGVAPVGWACCGQGREQVIELVG